MTASADSRQALLEAVISNDAGRVAELVRAEPGLARALGHDGVSGILLALYRGHTASLDALLAAGPALDVFEAAALGQMDRLDELLNADPLLLGAISADGFTPLHLAAYFRQPEAVRHLLDHGAEIDVVSRNGLGVTPLNSAVAAGDIASVSLLLERGADPNHPEQGGFTPLHQAAQTGDAGLLKLLLDHGANPLLRSSDGQSPLDLAMTEGHEAAAALLRGQPHHRPAL